MLKIQPKTIFVGKKLIYLPTCHSTNVFATELIHNNEIEEGTVIVAGYQTQGKGQRGNHWESLPNQNLLMSLIIKPDFLATNHQFYLSMAVSLSIVDTLNRLINEKTSIKWPNDLYISEKKIGGILIESSLMGAKITNAIIGIGINVFQEKFENKRASSIILNSPKNNINLQIIIEEFCESFEQNYDLLRNKKFTDIKSRYMQNLMWLGQEKKFKSSKEYFEGKIIDVHENGKLIIESKNNTTKTFDIKEIEFVF